MSDLDGLIAKHRANGLLIDSNLFLLYLVGATNEERIGKFYRTAQFRVEDFRSLAAFVDEFQTIVTTPHILTEVSNLAKLKNPELQTLRTQFRMIVEESDEEYEASGALMGDALFLTLGLTDAAIAVAAKRQMLVLTDDLDLYRTLLTRGIDAVNFNHIRPL